MKELDCWNGEEFKEVYEQYFSMIYRISLLYLRNTEETEDIVQDVFLKLLGKERNFKSEENRKAWLIQVTKNACRDINKSFWKSRRVDIKSLPELTNEEKGPDLYYVLEKLLLLPDKYKIVLYLFYYEDYYVKDISKILNIKESTIQTQLSRGRKLLKKKLRRELNE
ncbi:sigma-70 family RNA polymerase sigma factor [Proteiniborus sp. MB09-C3]|uniref:RNA polymerase sigma factor n=1 Tax=Proteiniborus sp. MB09-C3 TaxID=3050072 RepID=UPI0025553C99|nr:sigma-70 family RNA polymerase sigma factor [Proteiniborus sp. MB09-C3]WIV12919.1 sigma-70 family RNA polymerase sigma factor [Proteiniborus sp. MB09-C3]